MAEFAWGTVTAVGAAVRDATSDVSVVTPGIGGVDTSVGGKVSKSSCVPPFGSKPAPPVGIEDAWSSPFVEVLALAAPVRTAPMLLLSLLEGTSVAPSLLMEGDPSGTL